MCIKQSAEESIKPGHDFKTQTERACEKIETLSARALSGGRQLRNVAHGRIGNSGSGT
jgi:hypothetical protein